MAAVIDPYLEQQYNNRAAVIDYADYLNSWKLRSELFRSKVKGILNQSYGSTDRQVLDIFPLLNQQKAPVHVFIHGGYWQALDKDSFSYLAETFNNNGECAVILNYGLCPANNLVDIIQQIKQAMLWLYRNISNYGGDPEKIHLSGHSAGGHLLATLLTTDWSEFGLQDYPFQQVYALSGIYDLQPLITTSVNHALGLDHNSAAQCSPLLGKFWRPGSQVQLNLLVGELESQQYKTQSNQLLESWKANLDIRFQQVAKAHHFSILDNFLIQQNHAR